MKLENKGGTRVKAGMGDVKLARWRSGGNQVTKANRTRSKRGCNSCKAKKIKCDESKPSCSKCLENGKTCIYEVTLQFREDLEKQGKSFGREGVWFKNKKHKDNTFELSVKSRLGFFTKILNQHLQFINVGYQDLQHQKKSYIPPSIKSSIIPIDVKLTINNDISDLSFALNYYISFISPILNPIGEETICYLPDSSNTKVILEKGLDLNSIIQYSQRKESLFYFIVALGCIYLSKLDYVDRKIWFTNGHYFRSLGLSYIAIQVSYLTGESKHINWEFVNYNTDLLLALVFLTMFDIADNCNSRFKVFLQASKKLVTLDFLILPSNHFEFNLYKFCVEYLNYQDSISRTACNADSFDFIGALEQASQFDTSVIQTSKTISWMGCEKTLVNLITTITDLSIKHKKRPMLEQEYFNAKALPIRETLENLRMNTSELFDNIGLDNSPISTNFFETSSPQLMSASTSTILISTTPHQNTSSAEQYCLLLTDEIKRLSTVIYLECSVLNATPKDSSITKLVNETLNLLKHVVIDNDFKWCNTLLWSVFIASVEISPLAPNCEALRYLSLQLLDKLESFSLGNVYTIRNFITNTWKKRDLHDDPVRTVGKGFTGENMPFNDWESNVVDESVVISLA
jgi:hypothetical protein